MSIFHDALDKVFGTVGNITQSVGGHINDALDSAFNFSTNHYAQADTTTPPIPKPPAFDPSKMMAAVAYNETRGEKNPYAYSRDSGSKTQGRALGKYQVTEGELKTYSKKFLGQPVTSDQFLGSPQLQDNYMMAKINHGKDDLGLSPEQILATHRGGYTNPDDAMVKYKSYVDSGMKQYNQ